MTFIFPFISFSLVCFNIRCLLYKFLTKISVSDILKSYNTEDQAEVMSLKCFILYPSYLHTLV